MYIRKTGHVVRTKNKKADSSWPYRIYKTGRVLTLKEEKRLRKSADIDSIKQTGYRYYRIIAEKDERICDICRENDGKIYLVSEAEEGVNLPPFHPNCRCSVEGAHGLNIHDDPWISERQLWENIASGNLTFLEICRLLDLHFGDFNHDDERRRSFAANMMQLYGSDPEIKKYIEWFADGVFAMPVNPVPSGDWSGDDFPNYAPPYQNDEHYGRDLKAPRGTPIVSATAGKVIHVVSNRHPDNNDRQNHNHFGNHVIIELFDGTKIIYAHMQNVPLPVKVGDIVRPGDLIGYVGSSGNSDGNHLHMEVQVSSNRADNPDPFDYFPR